MNTTTKTLPAYIDKQGRTRTITRKRGLWYVEWGHGFSHMDMVKAWIEAEGYTFTRVPNRNYRPRLREYERIMKGFGFR